MNEYEPYGPEWEKELMRWKKADLINWIRMLLEKQKDKGEKYVV